MIIRTSLAVVYEIFTRIRIDIDAQVMVNNESRVLV